MRPRAGHNILTPNWNVARQLTKCNIERCGRFVGAHSFPRPEENPQTRGRAANCTAAVATFHAATRLTTTLAGAAAAAYRTSLVVSKPTFANVFAAFISHKDVVGYVMPTHVLDQFTNICTHAPNAIIVLAIIVFGYTKAEAFDGWAAAAVAALNFV